MSVTVLSGFGFNASCTYSIEFYKDYFKSNLQGSYNGSLGLGV